MKVYDMNEKEVTVHEPVPASEQYPWIDDDGVAHNDLIKHYNENGGKIICEETSEIYSEGAIDLHPCKLHYFVYEEQPEQEETIDTATPL